VTSQRRRYQFSAAKVDFWGAGQQIWDSLSTSPPNDEKPLLHLNHRETDPGLFKMAAIIKAANAKIRSNPVSDYICSTRTFPESPLSCFSQELRFVAESANM
jgi:hypothetical protein